MGFIGLAIMIALLISGKRKEKREFENFLKEEEQRIKRERKEKYIEKVVQMHENEKINGYLKELNEIKRRLEKTQADLNLEQQHFIESVITESLPHVLKSYFALNDESKQKEEKKLIETLHHFVEEMKMLEQENEKKKRNEFERHVQIAKKKSV